MYKKKVKIFKVRKSMREMQKLRQHKDKAYWNLKNGEKEGRSIKGSNWFL